MAQTFGANKYWIEIETIGNGGQGTAYKVRRTAEDYPEVLVLKKLHTNDQQALDRFRQDAQAVSSLSTPHTIRLREDQTKGNDPFYVLEYCCGGNLAQAKDEWSGDQSRALQIFEEICIGLAAAHEKGITHRDIKPENILLRQPLGQAVISDFGICHIQDNDRLTRPTERVGPRDFMAPELEKSGPLPVAPVNDVYSLVPYPVSTFG